MHQLFFMAAVRCANVGTVTYHSLLLLLPTICVRCCYLPFAFAAAAYRSHSLLLPTIRIRCCYLPFAFAAATYRSHSLLLPTVCIRCCHLPFAFAVAASPFGTPTAAARANRPALKILQKLPRVYNK
ncbi:hypothetical protein [Methanimicrococcus blatticola]|uniref:hypothetical protein n=1 Tax=Methanimicrococcus blatticola TaxID=91560 RepID=UPI0010601D08|nr:hypothetical protein [Methanimicrococcus blatticola]MBZ3934882.1 hypothetical protein [Methanimicrococcus blatticola]